MGNDAQQDLIGSYFLELWRLKSKEALMATDMEEDNNKEEEEEKAPTELDTFNSSGGFSIILSDKLSVQYPTVNLHGHDVGVVKANRPAPVKCLIYYFEIYVKNAGAKGQIAIGFTTEGFKMRRQPGWEANSYGYHGDDGLLYRGQGKGETFGPTYTTGDTVGGGINYSSQEFFFTKNGAVVGTVYKDVKGPLYPTVAVHSQNEEVTINFGKDPFVFDLKVGRSFCDGGSINLRQLPELLYYMNGLCQAYEAQERAKQETTIEKITVPETASYGIVRSYLQHYGYEDTLSLLDNTNHSVAPHASEVKENGFSEKDNIYALTHRKILRKLIKGGEIDDAFAKLREWYPQIVQDGTSATCFLLHCQKFIELVRDGKLEEAVDYGRTQFEKFYRLEACDDLIKDCSALLAYEEPKKSSVGYLLEDRQLEIVADAVNGMVLSTNPNVKDKRDCLRSYLERLLRQLTACILERRSLSGNQGEAFHLPTLLATHKNY